MYTKSDEQRRKQIFNAFIQKGCGGDYTESSQEEKSPAEKEREKEQNKK